MILDEISDCFRSSFFPAGALISFISLVLICPFNSVQAAYDITIYRMQHMDIHGTIFGSKGTSLSAEAIVYNPATASNTHSLTRRCILVRLADLTVHLLRTANEQHAACVIILAPTMLNESKSLEELNPIYLRQIESDLLSETQIPYVPIHFAYDDGDLGTLYEKLAYDVAISEADSVLKTLWSSIIKTNVHLTVSASSPNPLSDPPLFNILARLAPSGQIDEPLPSIIIVAHYDSTAVAPALANGLDSNGSGVIALLELARQLALLYQPSLNGGSNLRTPKYQILFLLSAAGKLNYFGTKKFLEDSLESELGVVLGSRKDFRATQTEEERAVAQSAAEGVQFAVCLDSLLALAPELEKSSNPQMSGRSSLESDSKGDSERSSQSGPEERGDADSSLEGFDEENSPASSQASKLSEWDTEGNEASPTPEPISDLKVQKPKKFDDSATRANIYMHVSRIPKPDSPLQAFTRHLEQVSCEVWADCMQQAVQGHTENVSSPTQPHVRFVHKKVRRDGESLSWEHEMFAVKKAPFQAITVSALPAHNVVPAGSIFDNLDAGSITPQKLRKYSQRIEVLAESLARYLLEIPVPVEPSTHSSSSNILLRNNTGELDARLLAALSSVSSESRAQQILVAQSMATSRKFPAGLKKIELALAQSIHGWSNSKSDKANLFPVKPIALKVDKSDPEFLMFDGFQYSMNIYKMKSNIFDFLLAAVVASYLVGIFFALQYQSLLYAFVSKRVQQFANRRAIGTASLLASTSYADHNNHVNGKSKLH